MLFFFSLYLMSYFHTTTALMLKPVRIVLPGNNTFRGCWSSWCTTRTRQQVRHMKGDSSFAAVADSDEAAVKDSPAFESADDPEAQLFFRNHGWVAIAWSALLDIDPNDCGENFFSKSFEEMETEVAQRRVPAEIRKEKWLSKAKIRGCCNVLFPATNVAENSDPRKLEHSSRHFTVLSADHRLDLCGALRSGESTAGWHVDSRIGEDFPQAELPWNVLRVVSTVGDRGTQFLYVEDAKLRREIRCHLEDYYKKYRMASTSEERLRVRNEKYRFLEKWIPELIHDNGGAEKLVRTAPKGYVVLFDMKWAVHRVPAGNVEAEARLFLSHCVFETIVTETSDPAPATGGISKCFSRCFKRSFRTNQRDQGGDRFCTSLRQQVLQNVEIHGLCELKRAPVFWHDDEIVDAALRFSGAKLSKDYDGPLWSLFCRPFKKEKSDEYRKFASAACCRLVCRLSDGNATREPVLTNYFSKRLVLARASGWRRRRWDDLDIPADVWRMPMTIVAALHPNVLHFVQTISDDFKNVEDLFCYFVENGKLDCFKPKEVMEIIAKSNLYIKRILAGIRMMSNELQKETILRKLFANKDFCLVAFTVPWQAEEKKTYPLLTDAICEDVVSAALTRHDYWQPGSSWRWILGDEKAQQYISENKGLVKEVLLKEGDIHLAEIPHLFFLDADGITPDEDFGSAALRASARNLWGYYDGLCKRGYYNNDQAETIPGTSVQRFLRKLDEHTLYARGWYEWSVWRDIGSVFKVLGNNPESLRSSPEMKRLKYIYEEQPGEFIEKFSAYMRNEDIMEI